MADNRRLLANLYTALEEEIFGDRLGRSEFATLMSPGQFISPNLSEDNDSEDMAIQAEHANLGIDTSFSFVEVGKSVDGTYEEIAASAALPSKTLTSDEERELETVRRWMAARETDYFRYRDRYFDALQAYEIEAASPNREPGVLRRLARARDDAMNTWASRGYKADFENRQARLNYLLRGFPATFWEENVVRRLETHRQNAPARGAYLRTFLQPPPRSWSESATSWSRFERYISESSSSSVSRSTSWSGGAGFGFGLFSFGGSAGGGSTYQRRESESSDVTVSFDYLRVRIARPWLLRDVFSYRWWTWKATHGYAVISDGGQMQLQPPVRPVGQMPVLPTHMILARNVRVSAAFSQADETTIASHFRAGASFGFGPFSLSGSYAESNSRHNANSTRSGGTFAVDTPQIIAYTGILLPACPSPDPRLPWPPDAVFPGGGDVGPRGGVDARRLADYAADRSEARILAGMETAREERDVQEAGLRREASTLQAEFLSARAGGPPSGGS